MKASLLTRLINLEKVTVGEPWTLLIIDEFNLDYIYRMMDISEKSRKQNGTLLLVSSSNGTYATLQYNPNDIKTLKHELEQKTLKLEEAEKQAYIDYSEGKNDYNICE